MLDGWNCLIFTEMRTGDSKRGMTITRTIKRAYARGFWGPWPSEHF